MSGFEYDYGDDFVEVRRGAQPTAAAAATTAGPPPPYIPEPDAERDFAGLRRSQRERADSVTFTPQGSHGGPSQSETGDSGDDQPYFSTRHHQFESSFRTARRRERAPLAPRIWDDMQHTEHPEQQQHYHHQQQQHHQYQYQYHGHQQDTTYDAEVEMRELPLAQQELAIVEDILSLLLGVSGRYLSFRLPPHAAKWRETLAIDDVLTAPMWISPTLAQMANKILPLVLMQKRAEHFTAVYARREAGLVNQALCAAVSTVRREYHAAVTSLENLVRTSTASAPYTLQQLWYHLYPHMQTFERLMHLIDEIQKKDLPPPRAPPSRGRRAQLPPDDNDADRLPASGESDVSSGGDGDDDDDDDDDEPEPPSEQFVVRGGHTLNILSDLIRLRGGDAASRQLYEFLLTKASAPFLRMLAHWLRTGELEDTRPETPGGEFMVASDNDGAAARTFVDTEASDYDLEDGSPAARTRRIGFVSVPELTPAFLRPCAEKIVRTGEYLNILRANGVDLRTLRALDIELGPAPTLAPGPAPVSAAAATAAGNNGDGEGGLNSLLNPQLLMRQIDQAYLRANQALLDLLFRDGQMMAYMGAVKRYLLFEASDFLTHFLDLAKVEVMRQPKDMSAGRLQSFLDLALLNPASVSHDDPLKDIVRVTMESVDLVETMRMINTSSAGSANTSGLVPAGRRMTRDATGATFLGTSIVSDNFLTGDLFMALQLQIPFPFTVVLDREALDKYTALSRLLLALKQTEQALVTSWTLDLKHEDPPVNPAEQAAGAMDARVEALRRAVFLKIHTVRHRMVLAIQQILFYCFWDVIEPQWTRMVGLMKTARTVDDLCRVHTQHLDLMFQQCGLTAPKLPKITVELLLRASKFILYVNKISTAKASLLRVTGPRSAAAAHKTVSGRLLAEMHRDETADDPEAQYAKLQAASRQIDKLDGYWNEQLKILLKALNHYARKFEESYLTLAVRLDCYRGGEAGMPSQ
ncbi:gamma tubulin complex Spc97/GCP2 subunit Alp4 [Coemansia javaensis]|uniref:Spindle pole body component n=1 Tax=Coemansia javaensis TaxID=2761396 RepID=A0A9W8HG19_9FUNG|nr:gamma tubulin complex Spc97/GCP2 subunit Alp4 [Coemansia javaensis]